MAIRYVDIEPEDGRKPKPAKPVPAAAPAPEPVAGPAPEAPQAAKPKRKKR